MALMGFVICLANRTDSAAASNQSPATVTAMGYALFSSMGPKRLCSRLRRNIVPFCRRRA